ncbi:hypothetical protein GB883_17745 [Georgenia thermotolerans]|uniref:Uncharacterized protein n=1 Tax=Georgenia thermotolerans TaxID=527326 RepID=A0A7J5UKA3_9MICO|nr:hypothetical protein GB883_17745 [Georgenia thermotolerans]
MAYSRTDSSGVMSSEGSADSTMARTDAGPSPCSPIPVARMPLTDAAARSQPTGSAAAGSRRRRATLTTDVAHTSMVVCGSVTWK